ncbi:MAG: hypothetical protein D6692_08530 [Planctomycetota bacterium]|nr:MAG: hypothetical protein D6692_08530 [Planctomycetota bacterium]
MPANVTEAIERAEIDTQVATAKKYPRSLEAFKRRAIGMATIDEETAESCIYRRPVGKEGGAMKYAEGMSVRMAEIVGASYGNLRVAAMLVEQNERRVKARGMAIDLESNFAASSEVVESTVKRNGQPYDERMRVVIAKAALAKARRDATFQVVPRALAKPIEAEVRRLLMGNSQTIERRRAAVLAWLDKLGIDPARVWYALGIKGPGDIGVDQLEQLTGIRTAIRDGDVTVDEAFPPLTSSGGKSASPLEQGAAEAEDAPTGALDQATVAKLKKLFDPCAAQLNTYLADSGIIDIDQDFTQVPEAFAKRLLSKPAAVYAAIGYEPPKGKGGKQ